MSWFRGMSVKARRRIVIGGAGAAGAAGLLLIGSALGSTGGAPSTQPSAPTVISGPADDQMRALDPEAQTQVKQDIASLEGMAPVSPSAVWGPALSGVNKQNPDSYAAAFTKMVLTQNYTATRDSLLAWVQAETVPTREPSVIGLIPVELRPRLAVWSVQNANSGQPIVPSRDDWDALAKVGATQTVKVNRVTEPVAWAEAKAAGQIGDPNVTTRDVHATVTYTSTVNGAPVKVTSSVTLSMCIQSTPNGYGFVTAVTYIAAEES